tara:strand:+ start:364 stop:759 length:396 start_codon:yes stop_codon:yes gene_type:complete
MKKICIVQSTYCSEVTDKIYDTSVKILKMSSTDYDSFKVSGSFEIPVAISRLIEKYEGFIAVGCIIKGETKNFEFISSAITNSIIQLSIQHKKPIGNAILTCSNKEQAIARINKGEEASKAVLDVLKNVPI